MLKQLRDLKEQIDSSKRESDTATTFPWFPKLPAELRLKVFHEVLFTQEIFAIGWEKRRESTDLDGSQVFDWEDYVPRIGSWHDFEVQAPSMTGKASLLWVNSEARMEALKVLQFLEIKGQSAWFNADVDVAWFPRFKLSNGQMRDEGFLVDHQLQRVTLRYKSWVEPDDLEVRSCTYRFFGEKALRELTLTVGIKDLLPATGKRRITAGSKPSEFHGMVARSMDPEEEHTWQIMEEEEMEKMRDWNEDRMWDRNYLGSSMCPYFSCGILITNSAQIKQTQAAVPGPSKSWMMIPIRWMILRFPTLGSDWRLGRRFYWARLDAGLRAQG